MAYVARYRHDVFISYAHNDDPAWIAAFINGLRQELGERLGHPVSFWQDENKLRLGHDWQDEIEEAITGAAAFLAVVSPSYRTSDWCGRERKCFVQQFPDIDEMKVATKSGSIYRFLKIIKMPWEDDQHLGFFSDAQHVDFFHRDAAKGLDDELVPGTAEFSARMRETAHGLASLLRAMRRMGEPVFVGTPTEDVAEECRALCDELEAQGYDVRPDGPLDELFSDDAIVKLLDPAVLSVHLFGAKHEPICERLVNLARGLEKKQVFWLSTSARQSASEEHRDRLRAMTASSNGGPSPTILTGPPRRMIEEVLQLLIPRPELHGDTTSLGAVSANGRASVYLLSDPSAPEDSAFIRTLAGDLREQEGLDVLLAESGPHVVEAHQQKLRSCDGVLLYRNEAPIHWLTQSLADVMLADRLDHRLKPLRAKAFVLDDPELLRGYPNVIPRTEDFSVHDLEPFLEPLRTTGGADAG